MEFSTPMMRQYESIKKQYTDCLLFYRMGDFYELFMDDAYVGHKVLGLTLTGRPKGKDGRIPMAGVPYHAVDSYISKLVKAGHKVAICEQMSEPNARGIVEREVVRIITPGTLLDEHALNRKEHNYILALQYREEKHGITIGFAVADVSTGYFQAYEISSADYLTTVIDELSRIKPSECILPDELYNTTPLLIKLRSIHGMNIFPYSAWPKNHKQATECIQKHFHIHTLESFGLHTQNIATESAAALLMYLKYTQKEHLTQFIAITSQANTEYVQIDRSSMINLELFNTLREHEHVGSLVSVLDHTLTPMGGRLLREWIKHPLRTATEIKNRLDTVEYYNTHTQLRDTVRTLFKSIPDIERILARLSASIANARDLNSLKEGLQHIIQVKTLLQPHATAPYAHLLDAIPTQLVEIAATIHKTIVDMPPIELREGGLIREGIHKELDSLRKKANTSKECIATLEEAERKRTGIHSLKVGYNKVFGFYIEVTHAHTHRVPVDYIRKQTLVNGERYITPELKKQEEIILATEERSHDIEYELFKHIVEEILDNTSAIQQAATTIAVLDCLSTLSYISHLYSYTRPDFIETGDIHIVNGRHPVVERILQDKPFTPNNTHLSAKEQQLLIITGPNMAGKSVYIRQVALITLLAHIGSFVPAEKAEITIVDKIFVRSGASDMITAGLSTFMVEMVETAQILTNTTDKSLIIMDEIGRGTSTYDGISIAWAIAEYLVTHTGKQAKTLFATHYHELQKLEETYPTRIQNYHMAIEEQNSEPVFLHTLMSGGASHSFGVAVAQLAGIPKEVIHAAKKILTELESRETHTTELATLDISHTTPLQALNILAELKKKATEK